MTGRIKHLALGGIAAALAAVLAASCQHSAKYLFAGNHEQTGTTGAGATGAQVECPKCNRPLACCNPTQFAVDGEAQPRGVAWACPVHGYVATTPTADVEHKACAHGIGKVPVRITDPGGTYQPAVILRCKECGAGGQVILDRKGETRTIYCAD